MKRIPVLPESFVAIDENGHVLLGEEQIASSAVSQEIIQNLHVEENNSFTSKLNGQSCFVEVFDEPLIAKRVFLKDEVWSFSSVVEMNYEFDVTALSVDEWDRFHGVTIDKIPFVFSRTAQNDFFESLEAFDDDEIMWSGQKIFIPPYYQAAAELDGEKWWSDIYRTEESPRWNLSEPAEVLKDMFPRLKLPRSRILVLGCGEGHDAAFMAKDGHQVTAVDISPEAIERAQKIYGGRPNLRFICKDMFKMTEEEDGSFDLIFEYTCYCAINPLRRSEMVRLWTKLLADRGQLFGVFFVMPQKKGPPFGASEWEIRQRLKNKYDFIFWSRWRQSLPRRQGRELFVLAQKKSL